MLESSNIVQLSAWRSLMDGWDSYLDALVKTST